MNKKLAIIGLLASAAMLVKIPAAWADETSVEVASFRNPADLRTWCVMPDATAPLVWRWAAGASSATLTVKDVVTGSERDIVVARSGEALDGSAALPDLGTGEHLVDVTLAQNVGTPVTARLKLGSPDTVCADRTESAFRTIKTARIYSWSDLWSDAPATTATLETLSGTTVLASKPLQAPGGFDVLRDGDFAGNIRDIGARLSFDGEPAWLADLRISAGLLLLFR